MFRFAEWAKLALIIAAAVVTTSVSLQWSNAHVEAAGWQESQSCPTDAGVTFNEQEDGCAGVADYIGCWADDGGGDCTTGINEGTACNPPNGQQCQVQGEFNGVFTYACGSLDPQPETPPDPFFVGGNGYPAWQTYDEGDLGPEPLPSDSSTANYDACRQQSCYESYGFVYSDGGVFYGDLDMFCNDTF